MCVCVCVCHMLPFNTHLSSGLCIPSNNTIFIKSISERLAANEPHLSLEFLEECIQGFRNSNIEMKHLCLEYMTPWLPNLTRWMFHWLRISVKKIIFICCKWMCIFECKWIISFSYYLLSLREMVNTFW